MSPTLDAPLLYDETELKKFLSMKYKESDREREERITFAIREGAHQNAPLLVLANTSGTAQTSM